ncbi:triacylglycerol lipase B [Aspergillus pseudonomiae]|uniref:feruloyl esterase n=1 Tax=Aspergillus pseudonomiae TaxID=1506151 RepID=A0A5N7DES4_9EURO|nr:triacylglycerol lipase B [Aspergillus pseudonomiae]KAB8256132.1 triacylglycerol lipase B [Aspergillus pseudonomiae]KAE8404922.1 triacylglycerol lipase B [Aspergillus pseudonomiae]
MGLSLGCLVTRPASQPNSRDSPISFLAQLNLFAQYTAAAYCTGNTNSPGDKVLCPIGNCPLVEEANTETLLEINTSRAGDVRGFVALDRTNRLLVISFRGTRSVKTWISNLKISQVDISFLCEGCAVHTGYWQSWRSVATAVMNELLDFAGRNPDYSIVITGHSAGAAIGTLAAMELRKAGWFIDLYAYGSPRVGNRAFAEFLTGQEHGSSFRITHSTDMVPQFPPRILGYSHFSPEYWVTTDKGGYFREPEFAGIQAIHSNEGDTRQPSVLLLFSSVLDHFWYFGYVSACI